MAVGDGIGRAVVAVELTKSAHLSATAESVATKPARAGALSPTPVALGGC